MSEKRCTRCGIIKATTEFYRRSDRPHGVAPHCKTCDKQRVKRYQKSDNGKTVLLRYSRLPSVKAMRRKWRTSPNGKVSDRASFKRMRQTNLNFRIADNLRRRLNSMLRRQKSHKANRMINLLGCSMDSFKIYLESLFDVGMSWENYGKEWEIDHIMPCALFDLTNPDHQKRCFHVSNMQPLWIWENRVKSKKYCVS